MAHRCQSLIMKTLPVYDLNAKVIGEVKVPSVIEKAAVSDQLIAQVLRVYLNRQRKAHASTKNRSEVAGTTKKMWAQKGTGRARHGSAKAPIFVGGGIAHGPAGNQNYKLKISQKMKQAAFHGLIAKFITNKSVIVIDGLRSIEPKTKVAAKLISGLSAKNKVLSESSKVGIITAKNNQKPKRAFSNLPSVELLTLQSLNSLDLSRQNFLIFTKKAISELK